MLIPVEEIFGCSKSCPRIINGLSCSTRGSHDQEQKGNNPERRQAQGVSLEKSVLANITYWESQRW